MWLGISLTIVAIFVVGVSFWLAFKSGEATSDKRHTDEERNGEKKAKLLRRRYRDSSERERLRKK